MKSRARLVVSFAMQVALLGALAAAPEGAASDPPRPGPTVVRLQGVGRGITLKMEPFFQFEPDEKARYGIVGKLRGTSKEFEEIVLDLGVDRTVLTAATRAAYEAYRIRSRGDPVQADVKPDGSVVRINSLLKDEVYASGTKLAGRTVVFVRGDCPKKQEAGLVRIVKAMAAGASVEGDEIDGWLPPEVKATWTHTPSTDMVVTDDGTLAEPKRLEALKVVREAFATVKRAISGSAPFAPVVRMTAKRDMMGYLSGRRDLNSFDAVYVPWAAELIVSPRDQAIDAPQVASEAAAAAVHYLLGAYDAEPLLTGVRRQAAAVASGLSAGELVHSDEARAFERIRAHEAQSWGRLMKMSTLTNFLGEDREDRSIDAELAVAYLMSSSASVGKASLAAWVAAFRKVGHPDAASGAAFAAMDDSKSDAEYWAYWKAKADPPAKVDKKK